MEDKDLNILTDEVLVKMAQEGSQTAAEYLITKYKEMVRKKAKNYFIVGGDNEDVIQEGMIGIFKAILNYDEKKEASFRTFSELCVTRQIITAINGANRQKNRILNESISFWAGEGNENPEDWLKKIPSGEDTNPESQALMKEVVNYLKANGNNIFSKMENQVWREMLKGNNYKVIALKLNKSPKAIDNAIQRIKKKIFIYLGY